MWWLVQWWTHDPNQGLSEASQTCDRGLLKEHLFVCSLETTMLHAGAEPSSSVTQRKCKYENMRLICCEKQRRWERWAEKKPWGQVNSWTFQFSKSLDSLLCISWFEFSFCHLQPKKCWLIQSQSSDNSYLINHIITYLIKNRDHLKKHTSYFYNIPAEFKYFVMPSAPWNLTVGRPVSSELS